MTGTELFKLLRESKFYFKFDGRYDRRVEIGLKDLAAFIDEYFLPRPLFEDGTPVKVGDEFALRGEVCNEVSVFYVYDDGSFAINNFRYDQDQRVMKPEEKTEALDADGVPIEVGDELYLTDGFIIKLKCVGFSNDGLVKITGWESSEGWVPIRVEANELTHKKPDSWEQLEEDARLGACDYCATVLGINTRKTAVSEDNEAFVEDIIRRAKALAGVKDE